MRARWYPGWTVVASLVVVEAAIVGTAMYGLATLAVPLAARLHITNTQLMILPMVQQIAMMVSSPVVGIIFDRFPARTNSAIGVLAFLVGLVGMALVDHLWQAVIIYAVLIAAAMQLSGPLAAQIVAAKWFVRRRGTALSLVTAGSSLGSFVVPLLLAQLSKSMSNQAIWLTMAALWAVLLLPAVLIGLRRSPTPDLVALDGGNEVRSTPSATLDAPVLSLKTILTNRNFIIVTATTTMLTFASVGIQLHLATMAIERSFTITQGAQLIAMFAIANLLAKFGWAAIVDRLEPRLSFALASALIGFSMAANMIETFPTMLLGALLLGLGASGLMPIAAVLLAREFGSAIIGRTLGLAFTIIQLSALAPVSVGLLRDAARSYQLPLAVLAATAAVAAAAICLYRGDRSAGAKVRLAQQA